MMGLDVMFIHNYIEVNCPGLIWLDWIRWGSSFMMMYLKDLEWWTLFS